MGHSRPPQKKIGVPLVPELRREKQKLGFFLFLLQRF